MKVKVSELLGVSLDWAVAKCDGKNGVLHDDGITRCIVIAAPSGVYKGTWRPTINWSQGGPIIERGLNNLFKHNQLDKSKPPVWCAVINVPSEHGTMLLQYDGPTPLIAAMRCYVASKLGEEVDIPEELV